ncbi:hypothetical protein RE428_09680 [Marinobacter nanhaiticus D15-8W]|uniref:Sporulation protein n=1 Tax=Marinobacter nanhaiticus D15-8W TaxID=626887 RepID=N6WNJ2_9GAMM|nr:AAA family ATPase [Marinobacter nanhaiticus]ENO12612.1 sporulation protein [Marinobacter nanhaiticus D15-8W]BES69950.1 hypothetical protein RE428_09680 [Marinobacter nanhaiticus D15-8W]
MAEDILTGDPGTLFNRLQERYGLGQDPLSMDSPFFPGAQRQYALETIRHLAAFGDMALLVTGERGSGKTRLLAELVRAESERLKFHRLAVSEVATEQGLADALLRIAHHGLGSGRSSRDAIFGFFKWSETATRKGQRIVLLLDDADHMPAAVVHVLLAAHRAADCSQCAVPVLTGADTLITSLGIVDVGDNVRQTVHQVHLRPLTRDEVAEYLAPRIERSGGDSSELLNSGRLKQLHELSQGSFSRLKRTAPAVWLGMAGHSQPQPSRKAGPGFKKLMWPMLAVVLLGASWLLVSWQYDAMVASETDVVPAVEPVRQTVRLGPDSNIWADMSNTRDEPDEGRGVEAGAADTAQSPPAATVEDQSIGALDTGAEQVDGEVPSTEVEASKEEPATAEIGAVPTEDEGSSRPESVLPELDPTGSVDPSSDEGAAAEQDTLSFAQQASSSEGSPSPEVAESAALVESAVSSAPESEPGFDVANPGRFRPVEQLRTREGYTAQYIAGYEEDTATDFLAQHPSVEELVYTRSTRKGKPWYVVIYGGFASRDEADRVIGQLPQELAQRDVWIRSFSGL